MVEGGSLENCCAERYRGFESYFLRQKMRNDLMNRYAFFVASDSKGSGYGSKSVSGGIIHCLYSVGI